MKSAWGQLVDAAASLNATRFRTLAASSLIATSVIIATALAGDDRGMLAAVLASAQGSPAAAADEATAATDSDGPVLPPAPVSGGPSAPSLGPAPGPAPAPPQAAGPSSPAPSGDATTTEEPETTTEETTPEVPTEARAGSGPVKHVFVISLSSPGYEETFGETSLMPYLSGTLRPEGELLTEYSLLTEAGLPNRIAAISGQPPNELTEADCQKYVNHPESAAADSAGVVKTPGCIYPVDVQTVADQVNAGGLTWRAYMEDMADEFGPANCVHPAFDAVEAPELGGYSAKQNPFTFFHSLLDLGACGANDVPLDTLSKDLKKADATPNYVYISPNLCNAGVPGQCPASAPATDPNVPATPEAAETADRTAAAASADAFLEQWVPRIRKSPAFRKDGALLITFGEAHPPTGAVDPLKVGALLISAQAPAGASVGTPYDPYSLLRSVQDLLLLDPLANAAAAGTQSFATQLAGGGD